MIILRRAMRSLHPHHSILLNATTPSRGLAKRVVRTHVLPKAVTKKKKWAVNIPEEVVKNVGQDCVNMIIRSREIRPQLLTVGDLKRFATSSLTIEDKIHVSARYLYSILPIRFSHSVLNLLYLPPSLRETMAFKIILDQYLSSCKDLSSLRPPDSPEDLNKLNDAVRNFRQRHQSFPNLVAEGLQEWNRSRDASRPSPKTSGILTRCFSERIGTQLLQKQHLFFLDSDKEGELCVIQENCSPAHEVELAVREASGMCSTTYGARPSVEICGEKGVTFTYMTDHLYYIVLELLKNSFRAVMEFHAETGVYPTIQVVIGKDDENIYIRINDRGGGIIRKDVDRVWDFLYTTAVSPASFSMHSPMAGHGIGLPIARIYARQFGGDLELKSTPRWGTSAFLTISRLGNIQERYETGDI